MKNTILFSLFFLSSFAYTVPQEIEDQIKSEKDTINFCHTLRRDNIVGKIHEPSLVIINYSLKKTFEESFGSFQRNKLSIHYMIDTDGTVYETIGQTPIKAGYDTTGNIIINKDLIAKRAWHTGNGFWNGGHSTINDLNTHSIGILFVNQGANPKTNPDHRIKNPNNTTEWFDFTQEQFRSFINLSQALKQEYPIDDKDFVGYGEVRFHPETKALSIGVAPGPKFFWQQAAENNVGIYHTLTEEELSQPCTTTISDLQKALFAWGYSVSITNELDLQTQQALKQLQIHHDPLYYQEGQDYNVCRSAAIVQNLLAQHYKKTK